MKENWEEKISCAIRCPRCEKPLGKDDLRILSVYDHQAICMECKKKEEKASDYKEVSKSMIGQCMIDSELTMIDPSGYCYHHFYPYKC